MIGDEFTGRFMVGDIEWLKALGLDHLLVYKNDLWIRACFFTAHTRGHTTDWKHDKAWRGFLLLLSVDTQSRSAIEAIVRMSGFGRVVEDAVWELFTEFTAKIDNAHVINKMRQRQGGRTRRMTGQGPGDHGRPNDRDFWKESLPPKVRKR